MSTEPLTVASIIGHPEDVQVCILLCGVATIAIPVRAFLDNQPTGPPGMQMFTEWLGHKGTIESFAHCCVSCRTI